jgi:hypothetical protein
MAMGTIPFIDFQVFAFFLFSFFFCSHARKGGAQLVSQRVMTEIVYYYVTPVHNASLSIRPLAFTLLCKCLFILARRKSPSQSLCLRLFGKFHFVRATPSTGNNKDTISCL